MSTIFGMTLRALMERYYIAEIDLARTLGVSPALIERWVTGQALPAYEDLPMLSRVLGMRPGALEALVGPTHSIDAGPPAEPDALERLAAQHRDELALLPPAFRAAVVQAHLRANRSELLGRDHLSF
jgi:transcriptional regulator with XRE-family HTH domain